MIKGIRKICSESKSLKGFYSGEYLQVNYDRKTGEAWTDYHYNLGHNNQTLYNNPDIIVCGIITKPVTMKTIETMIEIALERRS